MIQGYVDEDYVPLIRLFVFGTQGQMHEVEAVFDTGYNGFLTLLPDLIKALRLPVSGDVKVELSDGSTQIVLTYDADVMTDKRHFHVEIDAAGGKSIAGLKLFDGYRAEMQIEASGSLSLEEK